MNFHHIEDMLNNRNDDDSDLEYDADNTDVDKLIELLNKSKEPSIVLSLHELALMSIVANIDYWMEYLPDNPSKYLYIINPLDQLGTSDTLKIIQKLVEKRKFSIEHLNLFFHSKLIKMDFNIVSNYVVGDKCFDVLFNRCKNIKNLRLSSKVRISTKTLNIIPLKYPLLECFSVGCTYYTTEHLKHCQSLKYLALRYCGNLSDRDLANLKFCSSLQRLELCDAKAMTHATLNSLLSCLNNLTELTLEASKLNFVKLDGTASYTNIKILNLFWSHITNRGLQSVVKIMPNIIDLSVGNCKYLTTGSFKIISQLSHLQSLKACYMSSLQHNENFAFDTNVEHCLMKIGHNLKLLDLSGMMSVSTNIIGKCCPNVQRLYLDHCCRPQISYITDMGHMNEYIENGLNSSMFSLLEICCDLHILSLSCLHLTISDLPMLFKCGKSLKVLRFLPWQAEDTASAEEIFRELITQYRFDDLEELNFTNANGVNMDIVLLVLKFYPKLRKLVLVNCDLVEQEIHLLEDIVLKSGIAMKIEVSCGHKNVSKTL